jgi:uncharacterized RDD family membrane protein YckC
MSDFAWQNYEIPLSARPRPTPVVGHNKTVSQPLASPGDRLMAVVGDGIIGLLPLAVAWLVTERFSAVSQAATGVIILWLISTAIVLALQWTLLSLRGQTLGKMAMGLRVVLQEDGRNPGFQRAVLLRSLLPTVLGLVPILGNLFALVDVLAIFTEERRCLHDWMAGTKVVQVG